jgi:hypothetical protein
VPTFNKTNKHRMFYYIRNISYFILSKMHYTAQPFVRKLQTLTLLSEKNEMGGACSSDGVGRNVYRILVGKPEGKRPLGRPMRRWEDNIKISV